jgi:hypothetical protein
LPNADAFKQLLEQKLFDINDDYATERGAVLKEPQVMVIPPRFFHDYLQKQGKMGGQAKFPRVMKKEAFADWEKFVGARNAL